MSGYKIKNWKEFQHFKDRRPPWIKLYRGLLDDKKWFDLAGDDAKNLVMLWLIASENDGELPDVESLSFRLRISESELKGSILRLDHWLEQDDIDLISDVYQHDAPETETETELEREKRQTDPRIGAVFNLYHQTFKKNGAYKLTPARKKLIEKALKRGHSETDLMDAIIGMSTDAWPGRSSHNDLKYAIGEIGGIDNVAKWIAYEAPTDTTGSSMQDNVREFEEMMRKQEENNEAV